MHMEIVLNLSGGGEGLKRREKQKPFAVRLLVGKIAKDILSKGSRGIILFLIQIIHINVSVLNLL